MMVALHVAMQASIWVSGSVSWNKCEETSMNLEDHYLQNHRLKGIYINGDKWMGCCHRFNFEPWRCTYIINLDGHLGLMQLRPTDSLSK